MGRISAKLYKRFNDIKNRKIIDIKDLHQAKKKSEEDIESIIKPEELGQDYHPFHAVYISTQNLVSVLAENLTAFDELDEYSKKVEKAEDIYYPGYPPMSPVTQSLFTFWAFFDLRVGIDEETIGTIIQDLNDILKIDAGTIELIKNLQESRLGIYFHNGCNDDGSINLYEIFTRKEYRCYSANKYQGNKGEIWLVRLAPPPFDMGDLHITITTPYIIINSTRKDWEEYFERVLPKLGKNPPILAYHELMKYGLIPDYWNEYVFQAYSNHTGIVIFLHGIPDKSEDLPHFDRDTCIDLSNILTKEEKKKALKKFMKKQKKKKKKKK
ncbi:MAG: hypothetical protein JXR70_05525 [Spirochaetales bacterium]|nr:hypothetical protein [Spirochaetales bacterium]